MDNDMQKSGYEDSSDDHMAPASTISSQRSPSLSRMVSLFVTFSCSFFISSKRLLINRAAEKLLHICNIFLLLGKDIWKGTHRKVETPQQRVLVVFPELLVRVAYVGLENVKGVHEGGVVQG